jgi:hypothetical protein
MSGQRSDYLAKYQSRSTAASKVKRRPVKHTTVSIIDEDTTQDDWAVHSDANHDDDGGGFRRRGGENAAVPLTAHVVTDPVATSLFKKRTDSQWETPALGSVSGKPLRCLLGEGARWEDADVGLDFLEWKVKGERRGRPLVTRLRRDALIWDSTLMRAMPRPREGTRDAGAGMAMMCLRHEDETHHRSVV